MLWASLLVLTESARGRDMIKPRSSVSTVLGVVRYFIVMTTRPEAEARLLAEDFDRLIDDALDEREVLYGSPVFELHHLRRMRISGLVDGYLAGATYPSDQLFGVVERAIDLKLQMYLTGEFRQP